MHDEQHLRGALRSAKEEAEAGSDRIATSFEAGEFGSDEFIRRYQEAREVFRRRKIHEQKLKGILKNQ